MISAAFARDPSGARVGADRRKLYLYEGAGVVQGRLPVFSDTPPDDILEVAVRGSAPEVFRAIGQRPGGNAFDARAAYTPAKPARGA